MVFVDASAMISMMVGERDADEMADRLEAGRPGLCSAVSVWETIAGLCRGYMFSVPSARNAVQDFGPDLDRFEANLRPIVEAAEGDKTLLHSRQW